jgi:hypothetical protein
MNPITKLVHKAPVASGLATAALLVGAAAAMLFVFPAPAKAFDVPFDWSCNAVGTSCRAPGLQPRTVKFPKEFHKRFGYPHEIVVERPEDYDVVNSGWKKRGNCVALADDPDYPEVGAVKAKYCLFWQKGYAAPKPKIVKGW